MEPSEEVCQSLIKWLQSLLPNGSKNIGEISDGGAMLKLLTEISPQHFIVIQPKIKFDVGSNWRLKVSNLKKIIQAVLEYYQEVLNIQVLDVGKPDVTKIGESGDLIQLGKFLRLILGCAVNCERKEYITHIMSMEVSVQRCIMLAIQQLDDVTIGQGRSGLGIISLDDRYVGLMKELDSVNNDKKSLQEKCQKLETQVNNLTDEKQNLITERENLLGQLNVFETADAFRHPVTRRQMDILKDELFKLETARDDFRAKTIEQGKQITMLQEKNAELQVQAETVSRLKDELDALSESAVKVQRLENTVLSLTKKLEEFTDMKKQFKILEDKNVEYYQQNLKYEEELKKATVWKNQYDIYKKQAAELQQKLDEESQKLDRITFQNKNLDSKLVALQSEKERLSQECDRLREENDELKLDQQRRQSGAAVSQELTPTEMKARLRHLEQENNTLRNSGQDAVMKQLQLEDAVSRQEKLTEQLRLANQKILSFETQLEEQQKFHEEATVGNSFKEYKQKAAMLQEALAGKENELQTMTAKYNRNLEKAREMAMNMELKTNGNIESLQRATCKEMEENLMTSAFYRLSMACHREALDERLAILSTGQGQSFLSRQRQAPPRKSAPTFKSK